MSYISYADLVQSFGEDEILAISDRDRDGVIDSGVIEDAIAFADSHIDGYVREQYSVPLNPCPVNLKGMACDFARYRLYQDQPTQLVQNRYDVGCFFLKDVARGLVSLDVGDDQVESTHVAYSEPEPIFTRLVW
jgi:phage gp36-like protein